MSSFSITGSKGFHITFPNGYTISVQFGGGNYGTNYDFQIGEEKNERNLRADTVETAWWGPDGEMQAEGDDGDNVQGYQTIEQVWERMQRVAALPRKESGK